MNQRGEKILKSAGLMGVATFFSRILGLLREQVFAMLFGASHAMDAFNIAFRIPNLLRDLFAEGAMSTALVPVFTQVKTKEGGERAWRVAGLVFRVLVGLSVILSLLGIIFSNELVSLYAGAYKKIPGKFELTVLMTRIIFPFFPLIVLAAAFMGVLNACGYFFIPSFAPALFNLVSLIVGVPLVVLLPRFGYASILGMAIGVVVGGFAQAFSQYPSLLKAGYFFPKKQSGDPIWTQDPALKQMLLLMLPGMVGLAATQVNFLINSILATSQGPGSVSYLSYAFRLMQFPIGIFGVSLAMGALPQISKNCAMGEYAEMTKTLEQTLRRVFAINLPSALGFIFLGYPIIQLIYEYGHFNSDATVCTAYALGAYAVGLTAYSCVKVLVPVFYAMGNTKIPVYSSIQAVILTLVFNLLMIGPLGYWGLALGTSVAAIFNSVYLLYKIKKLLAVKKTEFLLGPLMKNFFSYLGVSIVMGACCYWSYLYLGSKIQSTALLGRVATVGILVFEGIFLMKVFCQLVKLTEFNESLDFFIKNLKKKLSLTKN